MKLIATSAVWSVIRYALSCLGICVGILFIAAPSSCTLTEEGIAIISVDKTAPQILSFDFKQRSVLEMTCSEPMALKEVVFRKAGDALEAAQPVTIAYDERCMVAALTLSAPTEIGVSYELTGIVEDRNGNTLMFSLPFTGYNDNLARLLLSEIRSAGSKANPEYVELYVLKGGNTAGIEIISATDGKEKKYSFPSIEVQAGEYITVHYRHDSDTPEFCIDELGSDLTLATATSKNNNCDTARDLWAINEDDTSRINDNDVILLTSEGGNVVMDAVLYAKSTLTKWSTAQAEAASLAVAKGFWPSADLTAAASSDGLTALRTLARQNVSALAAAYTDAMTVIPSSAADWCITVDKSASPGLPNSTEPYVN